MYTLYISYLELSPESVSPLGQGVGLINDQQAVVLQESPQKLNIRLRVRSSQHHHGRAEPSHFLNQGWVAIAQRWGEVE